tara:strand:+ start:769 stop:1284 length:516 start_codon:yes stop_codon:yes gene_type:complete
MKKAIISDCNKYRYELHREWDKKKGKVLFIMLNPSTADHVEDDLTTRRCIKYAERWGYGGIMIGNLYPFRAKRPKDLKKWKSTKNDHTILDAYEDNKDYVMGMAQQADMIVCAWGCNHKGIPDWIKEIKDTHYLELCDDGITPKHPLGNLSKDLEPIAYNALPQISGFYTN